MYKCHFSELEPDFKNFLLVVFLNLPFFPLAPPVTSTFKPLDVNISVVIAYYNILKYIHLKNYARGPKVGPKELIPNSRILGIFIPEIVQVFLQIHNHSI